MDFADVVERARRKVARGGYPNPDRKDCPSVEALRALVAGAQADSGVMAHVNQCSPCFGEFQALRRRVRLVKRVGWGAATAAAAVLVATITLREKPPVVSPAPAPPREEIVMAVAVDLARYPRLRSEVANDSRAIPFPSGLLKISLALPTGAELGRYTVRAVAGEREILPPIPVTAVQTGGVVTLPFQLDTRGAAGESGALLYQPPGLSWRSYRIRIDKGGRSANP